MRICRNSQGVNSVHCKCIINCECKENYENGSKYFYL